MKTAINNSGLEKADIKFKIVFSKLLTVFGEQPFQRMFHSADSGCYYHTATWGKM